MNFLYGFGVIIGICALYAVLTLGIAVLITEHDNYERFLIAWIFGFILFVLASIIALKGAGAFNIVRSNEAIEEVEQNGQ